MELQKVVAMVLLVAVMAPAAVMVAAIVVEAMVSLFGGDGGSGGVMV